jgi:hypothetical protein
MSSQIARQAIQAEQELNFLQSKVDELLKEDKIRAVEAMKPQFVAAEKKAWQSRARVLVSDGGNLWQAAAWSLIGQPVDICWKSTGAGTFGTAEDTHPPRITIDPVCAENSPGSVLSVFLHECGHIADFYQRDPKTTSKESREQKADEFRDQWLSYADRHAQEFWRGYRNGIQCQLLALINKPD